MTKTKEFKIDLTAEERAYITGKPEHDRRPGRESNQHLPKLWPVVPCACKCSPSTQKGTPPPCLAMLSRWSHWMQPCR